MNEKTIERLLDEMNVIWQKFTLSRAFFPHFAKELAGQKGQFKAPYYDRYGHNVSLYFEKELLIEDIERFNAVGHYINQNFIVRLYALLNSFQIRLGKEGIDFTIGGSESVDVLCLLRNVFAHTSGRYNPKYKNQREAAEKLTSLYGAGTSGDTDFDLSIDRVLTPIFDGCKNYVQAYWRKHRA